MRTERCPETGLPCSCPEGQCEDRIRREARVGRDGSPRQTLGRRLARLKIFVSGINGKPAPAIVIDAEMKLIAHAMVDIRPEELVAVLDNLGTYVEEARRYLTPLPPRPTEET